MAFEPMASNVALLNHSLCLNPGLASKLTLQTLALSDSSASGCAIVSDKTNVGNGELRCKGDRGGGADVVRATLDDMITAGTEIDLIKMDVEGHEMAVVRGGDRLFSGKYGHVPPR